jgi:hypothetical protein
MAMHPALDRLTQQSLSETSMALLYPDRDNAIVTAIGGGT